MRFLLETKLIVTNVFANDHCHCLLSQQEKSHHLSNEKVIFNVNLKRINDVIFLPNWRQVTDKDNRQG